MTRSALPIRSPAAAAASTTRTRTPRAANREAATLPSAPLLPFPAITTTRRPYVPPSRPTAAPATAAPARPMSNSTGSGARASTSAISAGVHTGRTSGARPLEGDGDGVGGAVGVGDRQPPLVDAPLVGEGGGLAHQAQ